MKISVCVPAYNRPEVLPALLDSILRQEYPDYDVVICEDNSPRRSEIRKVVDQYRSIYPRRIAYYENEVNLGYDGNLRNLIARATGEYCFLMGNDDLMCPGALPAVASAFERYDRVGVVLRSYAAFQGSPQEIVRTARYFARESFFPAGPATIVTFFRRSVVLPGVVVHREAAVAHATDRFDGTTLYQLYLVANILATMNGIYLPEILVLYRDGGVPDFGNSEPEKGRFIPELRTPESSLHFMRGMLEIAAYVQETRGVAVYDLIVKDIANYSYPILSLHSERPPAIFVRYAWNLMKLGLWRSPMFFLYLALLLTLGVRRVDGIIQRVKELVGHTPLIGRVYGGVPR